MEKRLNISFLFEIEMQCQFVLFGAEQLAAAEAESEKEWKNPEQRFAALQSVPRTWFALQNILVSAANISKLIWGSGRQDADRPELRDLLGIDKSSCLYSPDLRNDFEHFDERLERWAAEAQEKGRFMLMSRNIGPFPGMAEDDRFGHYEPRTGEVTFWRNLESIPEIVAEVQRLLPAVQAAKSKVLELLD